MSDPRYSSYRWPVLRRYIRQRDMNLCQVKLPRCKVIASCVDHRVEPGPPELGRDDLFYDPANLRASCASCNTAKRNQRRNDLARQAEALNKPPRRW